MKHEPIVGRKYLWTAHGLNETVTVLEVNSIPRIIVLDDGSEYEHRRTLIRTSACGWYGWYDGSDFELLPDK